MGTERLEVRLDEADMDKLRELADCDRQSVSGTIRSLINRGHEALMLQRRKEAVKRIANANAGKALEPEELSRLLNEAHSPGDLC